MRLTTIKISALFLILLFWQGIVFSQGNDQNFRFKILSDTSFVSIVRMHHPVARQADLQVEMANANLVSSRAGFDPVFTFSSDQKTYDGKMYYSHVNPELSIPTWFGIELIAGLDNNYGQYLNSELTPGHTSYAGIKIPVAKNLVLDKRRAMLQQARVFREQSQSLQALMMNDLMFEALSTYWEWAGAYQTFKILDNAAQVNKVRLSLIRQSVLNGDRAVIDSIEAYTQFQVFQLAATDAFMKFQMAGNDLSNYLWWEGNQPLQLPADAIPDSSWLIIAPEIPALPALEYLQNIARISHPKLQAIDFKLKILDIEKRLKFQDILPSVYLKGYALNQDYNVFKGWQENHIQNNNKFGIDVGVPLLLSQGRGNYKLAKLKIQETDLDKMRVQLEIDNKIKRYYNEWSVLLQQVRIAEEAYLNYRQLFKAEEMKFRAGESSLFLLNNRESKMLESKQKAIELRAKSRKAFSGSYWAAGLLQ